MKKRILFALMMMALALVLCLGISAKEYNPTTSQEITDALTEINASSEENVINLSGAYTSGYSDSGYTVSTNKKLTINLTGDTEVCCRFNVTGEATLVLNLNGYTLNNSKQRGGDVGCQFVTNNAKCSVEINNGTININDVCFWFYNGSIKCEGVTIVANEETIWSGGFGGVGAVSFVNCNVTSGGEGNFKMKSGSCNGAKTRVFTLVNSTFTANNGTEVQCPAKESVIRNCTFNGKLTIDSWCQHGDTNESPMIIENITINNGSMQSITSFERYTVRNSKIGSIYLNGDRSGGAHLTVCDCEYTGISYGNEKPDQCSATVIVGPTCLDAGIKTVYTKANASGTVDDTYEAPAMGHEASLDEIENVVYKSGYGANGTYICGCVRCDATGLEENGASAPKLITFKGFSTPRDGAISLVAGYEVDTDAVEAFENITKKEFTYGIVAAVGKNLGTNEPLDENGDVITLEKGSVIKTTVSKEATRYEFRLNNMNGYENEAIMLSTYTMFDGKITYLQGGKYTGLSTVTYAEAPKEN